MTDWTTNRVHFRNRHSAVFAIFFRLTCLALAGILASSLWSGGCARGDRGGSQKPLTTVEQVRLLPLQPSAQVRVHLRGNITYQDMTVKQIFLQDSTGGVRIDDIGSDPSLTAGNIVDLIGTVTVGGPNPLMTAEQVRILARDSFPAPVRADWRDLVSSSANER